jgi:hypothetical protein
MLYHLMYLCFICVNSGGCRHQQYKNAQRIPPITQSLITIRAK